MPQPTEAEHGHAIAFFHAPAIDGGIGGNSRAQQRGRVRIIDAIGDAANEILVHHHFLGVPTLGDAAVHILRVICPHGAMETILLLMVAALLALSTGIHHAPHAHALAKSELRNLGTHLGDHTGNLVAHRERKVGLTPLIANGVDIAMADTGRGDIDHYIIGARITARDLGDLEGGIRGGLLYGFHTKCHAAHATKQQLAVLFFINAR